MDTKLIDGSLYQLENVDGYGACLVPVKKPVPILKVGDKLINPTFPLARYVVYSTGTHLKNDTFGIIVVVSSDGCEFTTYYDSLCSSLEGLSDFATSRGFKKIN